STSVPDGLRRFMAARTNLGAPTGVSRMNEVLRLELGLIELDQNISSFAALATEEKFGTVAFNRLVERQGLLEEGAPIVVNPLARVFVSPWDWVADRDLDANTDVAQDEEQVAVLLQPRWNRINEIR